MEGRIEGRRKQITLSSFGRWKVSYMADFLIGADQKITDQLLKTTFLREVVTAIRLDMKPWFAEMGLSKSNSILGMLSLF